MSGDELYEELLKQLKPRQAYSIDKETLITIHYSSHFVKIVDGIDYEIATKHTRYVTRLLDDMYNRHDTMFKNLNHIGNTANTVWRALCNRIKKQIFMTSADSVERFSVFGIRELIDNTIAALILVMHPEIKGIKELKKIID